MSWVGVEPLGDRDGRIALYLTDHLARLLAAVARRDAERQGTRARRARTVCSELGASFFAPLHAALGGGFPQETVDALWALVWKGLVTNDTLHALRATCGRRNARGAGRARRFGRDAWCRRRPKDAGRRLRRRSDAAPLTEWATAFAQQLLTRHGVVTREVTAIEQIPGGFSTIYPVLRRMEETGRVRRGYFVAGLGAAQFAQPGAIDLLRAAREEPETPLAVTLAATDPANPYGALLPWPEWSVRRQPTRSTATGAQPRASRSAGARVILVDGHWPRGLRAAIA